MFSYILFTLDDFLEYVVGNWLWLCLLYHVFCRVFSVLEMGAGLIIVIVVAILIILFLLGVVFYARAKGKFCFAGKSTFPHILSCLVVVFYLPISFISFSGLQILHTTKYILASLCTIGFIRTLVGSNWMF